MAAAAAELAGLFAVYKPAGVAWSRVREALETRLLRELNAAPGRAPRQQVRFLPTPAADGSGAVELVAARVPVLADHPLVLGIGHGNKLLTDLYNCHLTKVYTVGGLFGKATDDFSDTGKLIEKTTFDHVTREKLERILAVIQGTNQKALLMYSNIDMKTQEAYELAVKGLIRPMGKSPPIITAVRCLQFALPEFQLEIHCLHETQQYLRKMVHEIGLELKSSAVCTQVRRIRDGVFTLDDALPRTRWDLQSIREAIRNCQLKVETELETTLGQGENSPLHQLDGYTAERAPQEHPQAIPAAQYGSEVPAA
uniref:TruB pseudouridine synthase family member 2 n=1 Tax=Malurus cyaneus samueli TaxID=2593467 RepID=A0A8C5T9U8_9PASS